MNAKPGELKLITPLKTHIILSIVYQHSKQKDNNFFKYLKLTPNKVARESTRWLLTAVFDLNLKIFYIKHKRRVIIRPFNQEMVYPTHPWPKKNNFT